MCSKIKVTHELSSLIEYYQTNLNRIQVFSQQELIPGNKIPIITKDPSGEIIIEEGIWGLLPPWATDPTRFPILSTARIETMNQKPSFAETEKCIIPVSEFKEGFSWVKPQDENILSLCGIYSTYRGNKTVSIVTQPATDGVERVFTRMPIIVDNWITWLQGTSINSQHKEFQFH